MDNRIESKKGSLPHKLVSPVTIRNFLTIVRTNAPLQTILSETKFNMRIGTAKQLAEFNSIHHVLGAISYHEACIRNIHEFDLLKADPETELHIESLLMWNRVISQVFPKIQ